MLFHLIACTVVSYGNRQRLAEGDNNEKSKYTYRHQAIKMRLTGQSVEQICRALNRSHEMQPA
jgi:hypothetical protein